MLRDPILLLALIAGLTALAFWLEERFAWGRKVGASLLVIATAAVLSNLGLVPAASPVYDVIGGPVTSLAIVWLLFAIDLRGLRDAGPRMLGAFGLAVLATACGALVAAAVVGSAFGDEAWKLAGTLTGTYAGGGLNFVAVGRALELPESLFTAATAADNVLTAGWIGATLMLPIWLAGPFRRRQAGRVPRSEGAGDQLAEAHAEARTEPSTTHPESSEKEDGSEEPVRSEEGAPATAAAGHPIFGAVRLHPVDLLALLALGLVLLRGAEALAVCWPGIPSVVWLTTLALAVGQVGAVRRLRGAMQLGLVALHLFFAIIGIGSRVAEIFRVGPEVFYFTAIVVVVHGLLVYGGAWLLRLDLKTVSVASQAAVGGPSTAMALAVARGWKSLLLPGGIVGLLGYAVGNYAGLAVAALVRGWLGG